MALQERPSSSLNQNTLSKESPVKPTVTPPTSLLWAHQLHREQNALSSQLSKLETSLITSLTARDESMLSKIDGLVECLGSLSKELKQSRLEATREIQQTANHRDREWNEKLDCITEKLRAGFEEDHAMLYKMFQKETEKLCQVVQREITDSKSEIINTIKESAATVPQMQIPHVTGDRHRELSRAPQELSRLDSAVPPAEPDTIQQINKEQPAIAWMDKVHTSSIPCGHAPRQDPAPDAIRPAHIAKDRNLDKEVPHSELIMQGIHPLPEFLKLGPAYIAQGYKECNVVTAMWKGLNDLELRRHVARMMPPSFDQWTYSEFKVTIRNLEMQKEVEKEKEMERSLEASKSKAATGKRRKRRRVIPVVWPTDEGE